MNAERVQQLELELLLEGIFRRYGYDFQQYASASLGRRVSEFLKIRRCRSAGELIPVILQSPEVFWKFVTHLSVPHTELFRDPDSFKALRSQVIPYLQTFPFLNVWIAGCASGEEAYSMAILLHEEGLLERTRVYCTDVNPSVLAQAELGMYSLEHIQQAMSNYEQSGGTRSWLDYFLIKGARGKIRPDLKHALIFSKHNLIGDEIFGEMHLVLCRNVLIYFNQDLKHHVLALLTKSLVNQGFLCLGPREQLPSSSGSSPFDVLSAPQSIYRLR